MREVQKWMLGDLATNTYLMELEGKDVLAVDIGSGRRLLQILKEQGRTLKAILLTHGHYDHIEDLRMVQEETGAEIYIHELDAPMLSDGYLSLAYWIAPGEEQPVVEAYHTVKEGDVLCIGDAQITVLHTPGHTQGSVCYRCEEHLFTGDTLFHMSRGRTDFPGGSDRQLLESFRRLKMLEGDAKVYPGHNEVTTLDFERKNNPIMRGI